MATRNLANLFQIQPADRIIPGSPAIPPRRQLRDREVPHSDLVRSFPQHQQQQVEVGKPVPVPPKVRLVDADGDPLSHFYVTFKIRNATPKSVFPETVDGRPVWPSDNAAQVLTILTDGNGEAEVPSWIPIEGGAHYVDATLGNFSLDFHIKTK